MLFDTFNAQDLNTELKGLMEGLSVKVQEERGREGGACTMHNQTHRHHTYTQLHTHTH